MPRCRAELCLALGRDRGRSLRRASLRQAERPAAAAGRGLPLPCLALRRLALLPAALAAAGAAARGSPAQIDAQAAAGASAAVSPRAAADCRLAALADGVGALARS